MTISGNSPLLPLQEEILVARNLFDVLKQEQAQLIAADIEALTELTEKKNQLVTRMSVLTTKRHDFLATNGFTASEAGMQAWLASHQAKQAQQTWQELLDLVRAAKEINRSNGLLINKHLNRNQSTLHALKGGQQGQAMYGPNGQSAISTSARGLAIG